MIIGIDGNDANVKKRVGVSVYTYELLHYFSKQASADIRFVVYLRTPPLMDLPRETAHFRYSIIWGPVFWSKVFLPFALFFGERPDVFFSPAHYIPQFCPCPVVVTIHDTSYEYFPDEFLKRDLYKLKNWTRHSLKIAKNAIAVSESTRKDIKKFYPFADYKTVVIHNGFRRFDRSHSLILAARYTTPTKNYLLFVGTLQPRKNIVTLIEAFALLHRNYPNVSLVIVGKKGWLYTSILNRSKEMGVESEVIFTGYLSDDQVQALYRSAIAYVLPSLYEGFGFPILEAMAQGCPVIVSNSSSLPEVAGEAALYFEPHDTIELSKAMQRIIEDKKLRDRLITKGYRQIKKFSWDKCGKETFNLLKQVASSSK